MGLGLSLILLSWMCKYNNSRTLDLGPQQTQRFLIFWWGTALKNLGWVWM
ncbi:hypothetical protein ACJW31_08G067200 [Castanea mollissima]